MDASKIPGSEEVKAIAIIEQAKKVFGGTELIPEDEIATIIEDCKAIITESVTVVREKIIEMKWELGDRLFKAGENRIRPLLTRVSKEINLCERDLYRCLEFRKKFSSLNEMWERLPEGKNISWHKLINKYIDFEMPKPAIPVEDKFDEFGLCEWWKKQQNLKILRLKDKNTPLALIIRPAKIEPEKITPLKMLYQEITDYFISLKKWDKNDLDRGDYNRMHRAIKQLVEKSKCDKEKVKRAIKWCHEQYRGSGIDWTLETVLKKYPAAVKPIDPMEKYLKKPEPFRRDWKR